MKREFINRHTIGEDLTAGLVLGIQSIPDGLANGLLALINPIYGLYGYMVGTFTGAFFTSSAFMSIQATSAMALVVASVQQAVMALTFLAALFIPLQYAVLLGVALAVMLYVFQQSNKVTVKAWEIGPGQYPVEKDPPAVVPPGQVTILMPYGSLFYAAAPVFSAQLPEVTEATRHAAVILALRGQKDVGSTFLNVLTRYAEQLRGQESKLILAGVEPTVLTQMERTGVLQTIGRSNIFPASEGIGEALLQAVDVAEEWIAGVEDEG